MHELLARSWALVIFRGVIALIFGIVAMIWPGITLLGLVVLFAAYAVVDGVTAAAMGIAGRGTERWVLLIMGVIGLAAGVTAFVWPGITAMVLLVMIAVWAIFTGATYLIAAWQMRHETTGEWLLALSGLATIALGVMLLVRPEAGALALVITIGVLAMIWGALTILLGLRMRGLANRTPPHINARPA